MTQDEIINLAIQAGASPDEKIWLMYAEELVVFAKLVAAKAIAELESQEPVAYINVEERKLEWAKPMSWNTPTVVNFPKIPLYTTPPQSTEERNFCPRCGKRLGGIDSIHTCTPPQDKT